MSFVLGKMESKSVSNPRQAWQIVWFGQEAGFEKSSEMGENVTTSWQNRWFGTLPISPSAGCQNRSKPYFQRLFAALFVQPAGFRLWASGVRDRKCWNYCLAPNPGSSNNYHLENQHGGRKVSGPLFRQDNTFSRLLADNFHTLSAVGPLAGCGHSQPSASCFDSPFRAIASTFRFPILEHQLSDLSFWASTFGILIFFWKPTFRFVSENIILLILLSEHQL